MILKVIGRYKIVIIDTKRSSCLNFLFFSLSVVVCLILLHPFMLHAKESFSDSESKVIERVVAFVEDEAITLTELNKSFEEMKAKDPMITKEEVINMLINRLLLIKEAKNMKLDTLTTSKDIVDDYIDIKIKSLIFIREEDIQRFYDENKGQFQDVSLPKVRDKIETYLIERETNRRLKEHLEVMRNNSDWGY